MTSFNISVKNLKEIIDLLGTVVTEAKFVFEQNGLRVKAVDPAHVAMVNLEVPREAFNDYQISGEEQMAIDLDRVKKVMRLVTAGTHISAIRHKDKLEFEIGTVNKKITLLDDGAISVPKVPQISSESYVVIRKQYFEMGLKAAEDVSDSIRLTLRPDQFSARSLSDSEESELVLQKDMISDISCAEEVSCSYPLEYLLKLIKSLSTAEEIKLSFKNDYPLVISFEFGQDGNMTGEFLLAPRAE